MMLQLGELLGKSLSEIRALPASEITTWLAYFKLKKEIKEPGENEKTSDLERFKKIMH